MAKKKTHKWMRWAPLLVVGLLVGVVLAFSPGEEQPEPGSLGPVVLESDSLSEGRHYDWVRLDSVLGLFGRIDPAGAKVAAEMDRDSVVVRRQPGYSEARFKRVFQNQRSSRDFRRLENLPIRMLPGEATGYVAPVETDGGVPYVLLPYEMMAGLLAEYGKSPAASTKE